MSMEAGRLRVLVSVLGLDQHEAGSLAVVRLLRDAGAEVVYAGRFQMPETIATIAIQEDVDVVGISAHSWEFLHYASELVERLGAADPPIPILVGGSVVTAADREQILAEGIDEALLPGVSDTEIVAAFQRLGGRAPVARPALHEPEASGEVGAHLPTGAVFDHVAHAGARVRDLLGLYVDQLGATPLYGGENTRVGYRGVMLAFPGGGKLELLEPLPGSHFFDSFFARNPAGGLHHLTFRVADVRAAVTHARASGMEVVGEFFEDERWQEAFVHPRSAHGTLVQLVQADPHYPASDPHATFEGLLGKAN